MISAANVPEILAISISESKGHSKHNVSAGVLRIQHGLEGDAHAGNWHRQISLLAINDIEWMRARGFPTLRFGAFAENLVIGGLDFSDLDVGSMIQLGEHALLRISQIGKECHTMCAIRAKVGDCIMPTRGLFATVEAGGSIRVGDAVRVIEKVVAHQPMPPLKAANA